MKNRFKLILRLGIMACVLYPALSEAQTFQDTVKRIDSIFSRFNEHSPGASLTISRKGEVIYHKHFGMANLENRVPVTDATLFEAGSVSKQFTATAILLLVREGKIGLDDDVRKYIPELPLYDRKITVRHLMNHTSGLKDWGVLASLGGWPRGSRVYTNQLALDYIVKQPTLNNVPGDEHLYSNSNYTLLTFIAERVSGKKLPQFTRERIFKPLGMDATQWRDNFKQVVNGRATAYEKPRDTYMTDMPFENTYGHAALLTTTADLDKWNTSWKNSPLGGDSLLKLRTEQGVLNNGEKTIYAGGVRIGDHNGYLSVDHSGATAGYRAWLSYFPEQELSICYLSGDASFSTSGVGNGVAEIFLGKLPTAPSVATEEQATGFVPEKGSLLGLAGRYSSVECGGEMTLATKGDSLWLLSKEGNKQLLTPLAADTFIRGAQASYVFKRDKSGTIMGFFVSLPRTRNVWFRKEGYSKVEELEQSSIY